MLLDADDVRALQRDRDGRCRPSQGTPIEGQVHPELMESTRRGRDRRLPNIDDARRELSRPPPRPRRRASQPLGLRIGARRHAPVLARRGPAHHVARPLPLHRRAAAVRRPPRARLRDARPRRRARPRHSACSVMEGVAHRASGAARALVQLAVLARRADAASPRRATAIFAGFPRSGLPPRFDSYEDYAEMVALDGGRPASSATTPTSGGTSGRTRGSAPSSCASPTASSTSTTRSRWPRTCRRWSRELIDEMRAGVIRRSPTTARSSSENKWLAARYGSTRADGPRRRPRESGSPRRSSPAGGCASSPPYARELGCADALGRASSGSSRRAPAPPRQLRVYNANEDMVEVMRELSEYTERA